ncbi:MAG: hypothetical protein KKE50_04070 [Nanoarchaeota archaeon]|nr:hypothetical protein [Nanoarchaeota archaeon]
MEEIPIQQRTVLRFAVGKLKEKTAPTSMGYNDMAVMIAYGQPQGGGVLTVNAEMISRFLSKHSAVPSDARMQPSVVQGYLEELANNALIDAQPGQGNYRMRDDISSYLVTDADDMKSPVIDKFLFDGFRVYSYWEIQK